MKQIASTWVQRHGSDKWECLHDLNVSALEQWDGYKKEFRSSPSHPEVAVAAYLPYPGQPIVTHLRRSEPQEKPSEKSHKGKK